MTKTQAGINRKKAIKIGEKYYYGRLCDKCGGAKRYISDTKCAECKKIYNKNYKKNNKERITEQRKEYGERNKQQIKEQKEEWYRNNPGYMKEWKDENPDYMKNYRKEWDKTSLGQLRQQLTDASIRLESGKLLNNKKEYIDYTAEEYSDYLLKDTEYNSLAEAKEDGMTVEHIIPVSMINSLDFTIELKFMIAMDLKNLMLMPGTGSKAAHHNGDRNVRGYQNPKKPEVEKYIEEKYGISF